MPIAAVGHMDDMVAGGNAGMQQIHERMGGRPGMSQMMEGTTGAQGMHGLMHEPAP